MREGLRRRLLRRKCGCARRHAARGASGTSPAASRDDFPTSGRTRAKELAQNPEFIRQSESVRLPSKNHLACSSVNEDKTWIGAILSDSYLGTRTCNAIHRNGLRDVFPPREFVLAGMTSNHPHNVTFAAKQRGAGEPSHHMVCALWRASSFVSPLINSWPIRWLLPVVRRSARFQESKGCDRVTPEPAFLFVWKALEDPAAEQRVVRTLCPAPEY